jgi:hypothetical protein
VFRAPLVIRHSTGTALHDQMVLFLGGISNKRILEQLGKKTENQENM